MTSSIEQLLETRERRGLRFLLGFRTFFVSATLMTAFITSATSWEFNVTVSLLAFLLLLNLWAFHLVRFARFLQLVGIAGALADLVIVCALPLIWHNSVGGDAVVSRAYLLKLATLTSMSFVMLIVNSVASRPLYPAIVTAGVVALHIFLYFYASQDPRVVFTDNYVEHMLGPNVKPDVFFTVLLTFVFSGVSLTFFTHLSRKTVFEAVRLEKAHTQVSRYFSPDVFKTISGAEEEFFTRGGRSQNITILFADLRDFTSLSEAMEPREVMELLREYHETMVSILFRHGGTLDKFIGDAIMATFGTPEPAPDDTVRAVRAALEMKSELARLNAARKARGAAELRQGIGIHCGPAIAGNVGTSQRLEYTVIGDTVNTASRLESATKEVHKEIVISDAVYAALESSTDRAAFEPAGTLHLKGKSMETRIYAA